MGEFNMFYHEKLLKYFFNQVVIMIIANHHKNFKVNKNEFLFFYRLIYNRNIISCNFTNKKYNLIYLYQIINIFS